MSPTARNPKNNFAALAQLGISALDARSLRRISMTLHRWHEIECGDSNDFASWAIARGRKVDGAFVYDDAGTPFLERHAHSENVARYSPIPDRERGALRRLATILERYPTLGFYVQGDPRGCALYLLRPGDVPAGEDPAGYYSRGVAVW